MITHKGTQTIYTKRLIPRKFTTDDAHAMFENWPSDERVTRYLTWCPHESPEAPKQLLELWCAAYENLNTYNRVMEYKGISALLGSVKKSNTQSLDTVWVTRIGRKALCLKPQKQSLTIYLPKLVSTGELLDQSDYAIIRSEWEKNQESDQKGIARSDAFFELPIFFQNRRLSAIEMQSPAGSSAFVRSAMNRCICNQTYFS